MRNLPLPLTAPAAAGPVDEPLLSVPLLVVLVVVFSLLAFVLRRRAHDCPDAEPVVEILEPADEAAETVGVGERVRLRILVSHVVPGSRLWIETPDGVVEAPLEGRRAIVAFRLQTPGQHQIRIRVATPDGMHVADEVLPMRVIRYEDALEQPQSDREAYLAEVRGRLRKNLPGRGSPG